MRHIGLSQILSGLQMYKYATNMGAGSMVYANPRYTLWEIGEYINAMGVRRYSSGPRLARLGSLSSFATIACHDPLSVTGSMTDVTRL